MQIRQARGYKLLASVFAGLLVWALTSLANVALLSLDRQELINIIVAGSIGGLVTMVVSLALQLRNEEIHFQHGMQRAAMLAELNHHIRNAVFPLCVAVQKLGNADVNRTADDTLERINLALRDATADALAGTVTYGESREEAAR